MTEFEFKLIEELERMNDRLEDIGNAAGSAKNSLASIFATLEDLLHAQCFPTDKNAVWERNRRRMPPKN
jgi:hypothetical protein